MWDSSIFLYNIILNTRSQKFVHLFFVSTLRQKNGVEINFPDNSSESASNTWN